MKLKDFNNFADFKQLETPCYILDKDKLYNNLICMKNAFSRAWGSNFIIGYSFKTNALPWVLSWMKKQGVYAEIVSAPEFQLSQKIGFPITNIILNGPYKGFDAMRSLLEGGGIVNLDSFHEIDWLKKNTPRKAQKWRVGIRINFDLEKCCPGETIVGNLHSRFGFNFENGSLQKAINELKDIPYVELVGIHSHNSTKTKSLNIFRESAKKIGYIYSEYLKDYKIKYVDMGGCFFGDKPNAPTFDDYADVISKELKVWFNPEHVSLIIEPGAALIASPIQYICKVIDVKAVLSTCFVGVNGSLIHIDPQMHGIKFNPDYTVHNSSDDIVERQVVVGFTCIEKDRLAVIEHKSKLCIDDYVVFSNVGSYTMALSPLFIQYFPCVYLREKQEYTLIREAWTVSEYIQKVVYYEK